VVAVGVGIAGFLGWVVPLMKNVDYILDARKKIAEMIAPTPVSVTFREPRLVWFADGRSLPSGDANLAKVEIVGDKQGDMELRNCTGELGYEIAGWNFKPLAYEEAELSYTFPKGPSQLVLAYTFDMVTYFRPLRIPGQPPEQTKLRFRVKCEKAIVSNTMGLIGIALY
jgi:hypothetical protein